MTDQTETDRRERYAAALYTTLEVSPNRHPWETLSPLRRAVWYARADAAMRLADEELQQERERLFEPLHRAEADNARLRAASPAVPAPATDRDTLRDRIAEVLTAAAFECDGNCGLSERECYDAHPIILAAVSNGVTHVDAPVTAIAAVVAAVLPAPTDQTAAPVASTAPLAAGLPLVKGRCPACGHASLFLGSGGYVTCSIAECREPDAASTMLERRLAGEAQQDRCPSCDHKREYHAADDGKCWFTADHGTPGSNLVCPCAPRRDNSEAQQDPTQDGEAVCIVAGCGHAETAHGVTGCRDCPRTPKAFHLFSLPAVARPGQPDTDNEEAQH